MTEPLSPAAQAVEDAYFNADGFGYRNGLAAALRAAIDQSYSVPAHICGDDYWCYREGVEAERERLQAIANELLGWVSS